MLEDNDRHMTGLGYVSFAMSLNNSGILVELSKAICGYTVEDEGVFCEIRQCFMRIGALLAKRFRQPQVSCFSI